MTLPRAGAIAVAVMLLCLPRPLGALSPTADLDLTAYRDLLARVVRGDRVDYRAIVSDRLTLDRIVAAVAEVPDAVEKGWAARDRMAFWINAYNVFTLRAIVDHYPIRGSRFSLSPRNSIRQIDGVWTTLEWRAAGRAVTLDDIEHGILRPEFGDARVHMAVNCASKSCPPLRAEPYVGAELDRQLDEAARRYLASPEGARVAGGRLLGLEDLRVVRRRLHQAIRRDASRLGPRGGSGDPRLRRTLWSAGSGGRGEVGPAHSVSRLRLVAQRRNLRRRSRSALKLSETS